MATKSGAKKKRAAAATVYECKSCGKVTTRRGHLCNPVKFEPKVVCELCGLVADDARHVCVPMVTELKYQCGNCGRVSSRTGDLCRPAALKKPVRKKTAAGKKKK